MIWQTYYPEPILFHLGSITIRWYGLLLVLAIVAAGVYGFKQLRAKKIASKKQIEDLFFYTIIFGFIGARFVHVFIFNPEYYFSNPAEIIQIWHGGIAIHGAILAGLATIIWWAKKHKINVWKILDCLVPGLALAQAIGRWGNYFNQELFGKPTDSFVGIPIERIWRPEGYGEITHFHPTFFYESILNLALFFVLHKALKMTKKKAGYVTLLYFIGYSTIRFFMEFLRIDPIQTFSGARLPQLISLIIIIIAVRLILKDHSRLLSKEKK